MLRFFNLRPSFNLILSKHARASSNFSKFMNNINNPRDPPSFSNQRRPASDPPTFSIRGRASDPPSFTNRGIGPGPTNPPSFRSPKVDPTPGGKPMAMDFVRRIVQEDQDRDGFQSVRSIERNPDIVHITLLKNNTFINLTDSKGQTKASGSIGGLKDKAAQVSRLAMEATAEHMGKVARGLGMKSVVMRVKGFQHFAKKRKAIMAWRDGFTHSKGDLHPIVYVEDVTRMAHNGCRLPKRRRYY